MSVFHIVLKLIKSKYDLPLSSQLDLTLFGQTPTPLEPLFGQKHFSAVACSPVENQDQIGYVNVELLF